MNEYLIFLLLFLVFIPYPILIVAYYIGWQKTPLIKIPKEYHPTTKISVLIPVRNEEENIQPLLKALIAQKFPKHLFEIIFINDHSIDNTVSEILHHISHNQHRQNKLIHLPANMSGKKDALLFGIKHATGELVVTTDADCTMKPFWLKAIAWYFEATNKNFIAGPVNFSHANTFFSKVQNIEFSGLIGSSAASLYYSKPLMCNGANMAFSKKLFHDIPGKALQNRYASGEDMFLMFHGKKLKNFKPGFLKSPEAIVNTNPLRKLKPFIHQRKRWVSKSKGYKDPWLIFNAVTVFMVNLLLLATLAIGIFNTVMLAFFAGFLVIKSIADFLLTRSVLRFYKTNRVLYWFPIAAILNIFYNVFIAFYGIIGKYQWKGRKTG